MRLLLDTSIVIRLGGQAADLRGPLKEAILNATEILVTPVARAEIGIKLSIGKLRLPVLEPVYWAGVTTRLQARELPFTSSHAALLASLPLLHRDPFDRMIACQCLEEDVFLATTDSVFEQYGVKTIK